MCSELSNATSYIPLLQFPEKLCNFALTPSRAPRQRSVCPPPSMVPDELEAEAEGGRVGGWVLLPPLPADGTLHTNIGADSLPLSYLYTRSPGTMEGSSWLLIWKRGKPGNDYLVTNEISTSNYIGLDWNLKSSVLPRICNNCDILLFWDLRGNQYIFRTLKYQGFQNMSTARNIPLRLYIYIYIYGLKLANSRNESLM